MLNGLFQSFQTLDIYFSNSWFYLPSSSWRAVIKFRGGGILFCFWYLVNNPFFIGSILGLEEEDDESHLAFCLCSALSPLLYSSYYVCRLPDFLMLWMTRHDLSQMVYVQSWLQHRFTQNELYLACDAHNIKRQ